MTPKNITIRAQQNAALVEEAAAAAAAMRERAGALMELVSAFKLSEEGMHGSEVAPVRGQLAPPVAGHAHVLGFTYESYSAMHLLLRAGQLNVADCTSHNLYYVK